MDRAATDGRGRRPGQLVRRRDTGADRRRVAGALVVAFNDPRLSQLITQALASNTSVKSAEAALREARALRDVAAAGLWSSVEGSASAQHSTVGGDSAGDSFKTGLDASWELDIFGANRSALAASDATARASAASLGDVQVSIAAEVALDYLTLRGAQTRLAIAEDNLASQVETLQIAQWRLRAGLTTTLEAEQARAAGRRDGAPIRWRGAARPGARQAGCAGSGVPRLPGHGADGAQGRGGRAGHAASMPASSLPSWVPADRGNPLR